MQGAHLVKELRVGGLSLYWTPAEAAAARRAAADGGVYPVGAWLDTGDISAPGGGQDAGTARCASPPEDAILPWLDCELRLTVVMGGGQLRPPSQSLMADLTAGPLRRAANPLACVTAVLVRLEMGHWRHLRQDA